MVTITATVGISSRWPNGKPIRSEVLPDGRRKHWLEDGRVLTGPASATYRIEYQSTWFGAAEGDTYDVNVSLIGLSREPGFVEVWNFDIGEIRNYAFHKIMRMHDLSDGFTFTGAKVCADLGGQMLEP